MIRVGVSLKALPAAARTLRTKGRRALELLGCPGAEISILLCGDRRMRTLNRTYRGKDRTTDVLSFPMIERVPPGYDGLLGDIVISIPKAGRQARDAGCPLSEELDRLFVHGLLHLFGYDHELGPAEARRMQRKEKKILAGISGERSEKNREKKTREGKSAD